MASYADKSGIQYLFQKMMGYVDQAVSSQGGGGGELEPATDAEYAAFKSHMATEIDNILTPITEE